VPADHAERGVDPANDSVQLAADRGGQRGQVAVVDALVAYRHAELGNGRGGRTSSNNGVPARCGCGRRIRVAESVLEAGPITCGLCGSDFIAGETGEEG
jgi:hypothetical protein